MNTTRATEIATSYFTAWSSGDTDTAASYLVDDVVISAPSGEFHGHDGFHRFMDRFVTMLTGVSGFTAYGDDSTAVLWYETHLTPVPTLPAGERITVDGDRITRIDITFDRLPMTQAATS
ncbi:nuclear transport factor 2 family protein [Actinomycetospora termitidis]|uniref:Nuclear transport factor 2 family protein n=1 Tax=Actinomycetospora termitidis TaxID=3053470 RepID=A0ABT7MGK5_9PSEU|nr:nuclear transport factor 2 family protein [Actinomycetospora sp. Odt1-22]MDL5159820.1 nuclear transport factor 2 family protein [Actinomycetospora sp. Odt1-22]